MIFNQESYFEMIFGNNGSLGPNQYFDIEQNSENSVAEIELNSDPNLTLEILHIAFTDFNSCLSQYNCYQLANGLYYIFNPSFSDLGFIFQNTQLDLKKRVKTIEALSGFILHVFEKNAEPILGHISQKTKDKANSELNEICYMFWDVACIPYNCQVEIQQACLGVMGQCALSNNIAVVEGALHGLGHAQLYLDGPKLQSYIQNAHIQDGPLSDTLKTYALNAQRGYIL